MTFSVQLPGLPTGRMKLAGQEGVMIEEPGSYSIRSTFATRGVASLVDASFALSASFSVSELKGQTVYPFSVTYIPSGSVMRAQALTVRTSYGAAGRARQE